MPTDGAVTAILVSSPVVRPGTRESPDGLARLIASLRRQTVPPAQIICLDQTPAGQYGPLAAGPDADVEVIAVRRNVGYPSACNQGARRAEHEFLLFINPDAEADASCIEELRAALVDSPQAVIAGAEVLLPGRDRVNAGDNVLHLSGLSWAGRYGLPPEDGPPRAAVVVSGAALLVRRSAFEAMGGYTEGFFMYYDDVDLAWRAQLRGWQVLFCPHAKVEHDYEFAKGSYKWLYLERNRWWCLLAHLEGRTLLLLAPLLAAVELAIWTRAATEGWLGPKFGSYRALWTDRNALRARRAEIQASRSVGDRAIIERMSTDADSPFLASRAVRLANPAVRVYERLIYRLVPSRACM